MGHAIDSEEQFERMYRQHERKVLAYALRRAPAEMAKDAVAEAFLAAWRRFDELSEDPVPWLIAAARKALANQRRSSGRQARLALRLELPLDVTAPGNDFENAAAVRAALHRLRSGEREALALIGWDGLTPTQAARSLGCSAPAFRVRLHRARRRLERFLAEEQKLDSSTWHHSVGAEEVSQS